MTQQNNNIIVFLIMITITTTTIITITNAQNQMRFRIVKQNTTIVDIEPFYNQITYSSSECYLKCVQQIKRCSFVEIAINTEPRNTWLCKLYHLNATSETHTINDVNAVNNHLLPLEGCDISAPQVPKDCMELRGLGFKTDDVYFVRQSGSFAQNVYCDMTTDGGGWIVIQKRIDGSVDFNRDWDEYKSGFGDLNNEFWIGNDFLHQYTNTGTVEMIAEGTAFDSVRIAVKIHQLRVGDEASNYVFTYRNCVSLTIGDSEIENGCDDWDLLRSTKFSTKDRDNDDDIKINCAVLCTGGFWYSSHCFIVTPNSDYSNVPKAQLYGVFWKSFRGIYESLKSFKIMVRRVPSSR